MRTLTKTSIVLGIALALIATITGCPRMTGDAKTTVLLTAGSLDKNALKADVPVEDIESLTVTLTQISFDYAGMMQEGAEEGMKSKVVVFDGAIDINLLDLLDVANIIATADLPDGFYTKIRLSIENPRLVLKSQPDVELTNIHLTANGRLFISKEFELTAEQNNLILLSFGGIKLVELGNGNYTLTPQLDAEIDVVDADVVATGAITAVSTEDQIITVALPEGDVVVDYSAAQIWLPTDTDTPTGTPADLVVGVNVEITGVLNPDGHVTAASIRVVI